jgi:hypothetical protein
MTTRGVDFPEDAEKICSGFTHLPLVIRISGDTLTGLDKVLIVAIAIEHDPLSLQ